MSFFPFFMDAWTLLVIGSLNNTSCVLQRMILLQDWCLPAAHSHARLLSVKAVFISPTATIDEWDTSTCSLRPCPLVVQCPAVSALHGLPAHKRCLLCNNECRLVNHNSITCCYNTFSYWIIVRIKRLLLKYLCQWTKKKKYSNSWKYTIQSQEAA